MVSEEKIYKTLDPCDRASLDPRTYVEDYYTLLHNKYISGRPNDFREEGF